MKKIIQIPILTLLILLSFGVKSQTKSDANCETQQISTYKHLSELSQEKRIEAIKHFLETGDCEYEGIKLYGKVQFVESFPDIKIKYVNSFPDIKVKFVTSFPDDCGEWQVVNSFPDFKVQIVNSFPDIEVKVVDSFPGMD